MSRRDAIVKPVEKEMEVFNRLYDEVLQGHSPDFQSMIDFVRESSGKKIRPIVSLLTAKICGDVNENTLNYAVVLELLHTATLIHDDVVDDTKVRRGRPSVNAQYDNRMAVLLGDYVLSLSIVRAVMSQSLQILGIISRLAQNLAEGELSQWASSGGKNIEEDRYFEIIRKKTAVLLSSCSEMGALSAKANKETVEKFRLFGEYLGICFQIKDDIFDYYEEGQLGKPTGNDLREGKITLPLIYALKNTPANQSAEMLELIKNSDFTAENIKSLINFAKESGGIEYARGKMEETKQKALDILSEFPESEAKNAIIQLVDYIIERKK
ncbi:MAG: polyprenyl synthetase family protein [Dysgonamonadaceae bacterium]|nr:polyprenyl synthetase family protein [Dysgonamonadaceae bacterium]